MMFGDVPTRVTVPPSNDANAIGISRAAADVPVRRATCNATGIRIARAPTFFVTMERIRTAAVKRETCVCVVFRYGRIGRRALSTTPDLEMASLTTSAAAMMMTISLAKPSKACFTGTSPSRIPTSSAASATRSYAMRPQTNKPIVAPSRPKASA